MKFSVLLPTRNRLDLLPYAVESVLRQNYDDWELVISDNYSEDDVEGYVKSLNDSRITYHRTKEFVSVTENWNNALERSTGDYVIMLGDDDCLMADFFTIMADLIHTYERPDMIYTDAYLFGYPGVLPGRSTGILRHRYNTYFETREPFLLDHKTALDIVRNALALNITVLYNMQLSVISQDLIGRLTSRGPFFQSPFPDYYATVVSFLKSERILIYQQPVVTIGISPKSFGYYYFNYKQKDGADFLNSADDETPASLGSILMPGSWELTSRLTAMHTVYENHKHELQELGMRVSYNRYRRAQIFFNFKGHFIDRRISRAEFADARASMRIWERLLYGTVLGFPFRLIGLLSVKARQSLVRFVKAQVRQEQLSEEELWPATEYLTILDVFENMPARHMDRARH